MMRRLSNICATVAALLTVLLLAASVPAAELHSNGLGGGDWSDPLSWREKTVPKPEDDAVISRGDVIVFDRDDDGKTTCKQIFVDPNGSLTFKTGGGKIMLCVAGQIEAFGTILIDGSKSSSDKFELRFVGPDTPDRMLKLMKGGKLTVNGRRSLPHGKHNVTLSAAYDPMAKTPPLEATVEAKDGASIDAQRSSFVHTHVNAYDIDNTGAEIGERMNVIGNHFWGLGRLSLTNCDSPLVADNLFELSGVVSTPYSAIFMNVCQLAEIRDNVIRGRYSIGLQARSMVDGALTGGEYEDAGTGVYWYGVNGMLKDLKIRKCATGLTCTSMSGVVDNVRIENCATGYYHALANVQMSNLHVVEVPKDGVMISYYSGPLKLLNCNITPEQIVPTKAAPAKAKDGVVPIEFLHYLVVRPKGKVPTGSRVEVRTADRSEAKKAQAARAADPNVRNSPAPLRFDGLTPLPESLEPLIVRGWTFDDDIKPVAPPSYLVSIVPAAASGDAAPPLATQTVTPDATWYRAEPNKPEPTLEVAVP